MSDAPDPFDELERMIERMNRRLESAVGTGTADPTASGLALDVADEGDAFVVTADLPGFDSDRIEIRLDGTRLTIGAERETESDVAEADYVRRERRLESVNRSMTLPEEVVESDVSATHDNGVLTVRLPKATGDAGGTTIDIE